MSVRVLLDTNVVSYIYRGCPLGVRYRSLVEPCVRHVTPFTIGELHRGALVRQ